MGTSARLARLPGQVPIRASAPMGTALMAGCRLAPGK
jgi:hypothetical protein